jgi:hypothetical protein
LAEDVVVEGQSFRRRSPWGVWGLSLVTLGIYHFVWYYKINDEARRYLRDDSIRPGLAVLALFVPIVNYVSIYRTGQRIQRMEDRVGIQRAVEPILGLLGAFFLALFIPYFQDHLNGVWDRALASASGLPPSPGRPSIPPPPPPPPPPLPAP